MADTGNHSMRKEGEYLFLGKTLTLKPGNYTSIAVKGDWLLFPQAALFRKDKELTSWYITQARALITRQTERYAKEMKTDFKEITFSDTRSQWGRCTYDNRLQFSWRLIMAPLLVLNYVVIHELAHTFEKNHTQMFWMKVRNFNPSYRQQIKWLKEYGTTLKV
jgi:predicted metal-dependent hydrolase